MTLHKERLPTHTEAEIILGAENHSNIKASVEI